MDLGTYNIENSFMEYFHRATARDYTTLLDVSGLIYVFWNFRSPNIFENECNILFWFNNIRLFQVASSLAFLLWFMKHELCIFSTELYISECRYHLTFNISTWLLFRKLCVFFRYDCNMVLNYLMHFPRNWIHVGEFPFFFVLIMRIFE